MTDAEKHFFTAFGENAAGQFVISYPSGALHLNKDAVCDLLLMAEQWLERNGGRDD